MNATTLIALILMLLTPSISDETQELIIDYVLDSLQSCEPGSGPDDSIYNVTPPDMHEYQSTYIIT